MTKSEVTKSFDNDHFAYKYIWRLGDRYTAALAGWDWSESDYRWYTVLATKTLGGTFEDFEALRDAPI